MSANRLDDKEANELREIATDVIHRLGVHMKRGQLEILRIQIDNATSQMASRISRATQASALVQRRTNEEMTWKPRGLKRLPA